MTTQRTNIMTKKTELIKESINNISKQDLLKLKRSKTANKDKFKYIKNIDNIPIYSLYQCMVINDYIVRFIEQFKENYDMDKNYNNDSIQIVIISIYTPTPKRNTIIKEIFLLFDNNKVLIKNVIDELNKFNLSYHVRFEDKFLNEDLNIEKYLSHHNIKLFDDVKN